MNGRLTRQSLLLVGLFVALLTALYHDWLFLHGTFPDEEQYRCAFEHVSHGLDPFRCEGYLYPYVFASLGARATRAFGEYRVSVGLRAANVFGLALLVERSLALVPWLRLRHRIVLGLMLVALLPGVRHVLVFGNIAGLVNGLAVAGVVGFAAQPWLAGALLGVSVGLKPTAAVAVWMLFAFGFVRRGTPEGRSALRAASLATALVLAGLLAAPAYLRPLFAVTIDLDRVSIVSLARGLHGLGLGVPPLVLLLTTSVLGAAWASRLSARLVGPVALAVGLLALPLVWKHGYLLVVPLQALAFSGAALRLRAAQDRPARSSAILELLLLALATALLFDAEALPLLSPWVGPKLLGAITTALALSPTAVALHVWTRDELVTGA